MPEYSQIAGFMKWAAEISSAEWIEEERADKVDLAERLDRSRQKLVFRDDDWIQFLLDDLWQSKLLDRRFLGSLKDLGQAQRDELRTAIEELWVNDPKPASLTSFVQATRRLGQELSQEHLLALGSVLLMAGDPGQFPPYRPEPSANFLKLIGADATAASEDPATERYNAFLAALDEVLRAAPAYGLTLVDRLDAQALALLVVNCSPLPEWVPDRKRQFLAWRDRRQTTVLDNDELRSGPHPLLEEAAAAIIGPGFTGGPSPFDADVVTWTAENARELYRRIYENADEGEGSFMEKLSKQLAGVERGVVLLAAELITLQCLPLASLRPETKMARVNRVLSWAEPSPEIPETLEKGLHDGGAFGGGSGFNMQLWRHLSWLCELVMSLRSSEEAASEAAASPEGLHLRATAVTSNLSSIRYAIEYLAWPGFFEPIVNRDHRQKIRNAFAHEIQGLSGDDDFAIAMDLFLIRRALEQRTGARVEWYDEPYASQWKPGADPAPRAWLVRQAQSGSSMAGRWAAEEFVSLEAQYLGAPEAGGPLTDLQTAVDNGYPHLDYSERRLRARSYHLFLSLMKPEDLVVTVHGSHMKVGVIGGPAEYRQDEHAGLVREVAWQGRAIPTETLPTPFPRLLEEQGTVIDMTEALPLMLPWLDPDPAPCVAPAPVVPVPPVPSLTKISDQLADKLFMDRDDLQEVADLLQSRNQIVFYGPPGTGKTFLAGKLARYLAGEEHPDHVVTVQFHPSYAYEDFFEGYRPVSGADNQVGFSLQPGPLRRIAAQAAANRDKPFFLVIDEMNRGNLAKVFGELYFLLEYRDQSIDLQYNSQEKFVLPPNLFIVGTMNTADRSVAMVDAAIRRRFAFVELHPQEGMTSGLLERFLAAQSMDPRPARLLDALNAEIAVEDRDLMIGPSYFMKEHSTTPAGLKQVWKYELMPLLEEHYYGRMSRPEIHDRFGLAAVEHKVDGSAASGL